MPASPTVLHYVGYDDDRGGIVSVVRALAVTGAFPCILGVNTGFVPSRELELPVMELPLLAGETIGLRNLWRARAVARAVHVWLQADASRVFHGHSRAGLLVALWLQRWGERRIVVSVHCYGRQRWFYRWAVRQLGGRLFWLTPAMRRYYGVSGRDGAQCIPGCMAEGVVAAARKESSDIIRLVGVGALVRWKGWHHVMDALAALPETILARLRFRHIGKDDGSAASRAYAQELRERTKAVGLKKNIEWLGQQPSSTPLLAESEALIVASENEPFSIAMLEALRAGVPVIAADSGGAVDLIEPPKNGLLFKSGSPQDLARVLRSLVETDALAKIQIDRESLRRFSAPVVAQQWSAVYARL
jgi:glycosyltransferase involved in cell wall biosynthesis